MVTKRLRNQYTLSSATALLGTLQPRALGFLNCLVTLVLVSNLYLIAYKLDRDGFWMWAYGRVILN